ncbi:hypothetical protein E2C01_083224 [Portunus trituberculatus]|uniref:Uncharacterized protein n=1 Tax=Portunus trituberculatus TaxID=210409 RepID=A0A5B7J1E2_PORTR|nr:hypothetical protein [Portunus trituberculatus]
MWAECLSRPAPNLPTAYTCPSPRQQVSQASRFSCTSSLTAAWLPGVPLVFTLPGCRYVRASCYFRHRQA